MIPRILHQVWVGGAPMPPEYAQWREGWIELHPGWEHRLWTDVEVNNLTLLCREDYLTATTMAEKADIIRYEVLFRFGGVYLDLDVEPQKPLDRLLDTDAFVVMEDPSGPWFGNAVLGAREVHPFFAKLLDKLPDSRTEHWMRPTNERTGPVFLTRNWVVGDSTVYPRPWFYPYGHDEKERRREAFPESYGVHHWMGSWLKEEA